MVVATQVFLHLHHSLVLYVADVTVELPQDLLGLWHRREERQIIDGSSRAELGWVELEKRRVSKSNTAVESRTVYHLVRDAFLTEGLSLTPLSHELLVYLRV